MRVFFLGRMRGGGGAVAEMEVGERCLPPNLSRENCATNGRGVVATITQ